MPMGIVSDQEFESQLNNTTTPPTEKFIPPIPPKIEKESHPSNSSGEVISGEVVEIKSRGWNGGRGIGSVQVPDSLRKLIAETHAIEGREAALNLAKDFGVSSSSVSAYAKGATSTKTYDEPKQDIIAYVRARKNRVTKKALKVMQSSLDLLTEDRLAGAKAKDISGIARDMSTIIGNMSDSVSENSVHNGPTFVLYSPQQTEESKFKVISSNE